MSDTITLAYKGVVYATVDLTGLPSYKAMEIREWVDHAGNVAFGTPEELKEIERTDGPGAIRFRLWHSLHTLVARALPDGAIKRHHGESTTEAHPGTPDRK